MGGVSEKAPHGHWRNPRQSSMGFIPENQVRTRLPAGGRRIRTIGPGTKEPVFVAEGELRDRTGAAKKGCFLCGTDGSNPSPFQRRVRLSPGAAVEGREPRFSARLCAADLATGSAETRRALQDRANRRQYLCGAIFQYRSAADGFGANATPVPIKSGRSRA